MWRLHRYLFSSVATFAVGSFAVLVFFLVAANMVLDLFDRIDEGQVTPDLLGEVFPLLLLYSAPIALPVGTLIGILVVMGRLSASSELTAMKAAGLSLWRLSAPLVLFCILGTALTAWINASLAPTSRASYKEIMANAVRRDPLAFIVPNRFVHDFPGLVVFVGEKERRLIRDLWIWELDEKERVVRSVRAEAGSLRYDADSDALIISIENGLAELRDEENPEDLTSPQPTIFLEQTSFRLPFSEIFGAQAGEPKLANLPLDQKLDRLYELRQRRARAPTEEQAEIRAEEISVQFKVQRAFASAFSVFSLGLLAIPLGLKASRQETLVNVVFAVLMTAVYYLSTEMISWLETAPEWRADLLIWAPNLFCQGLALWLLIRANRN